MLLQLLLLLRRLLAAPRLLPLTLLAAAAAPLPAALVAPVPVAPAAAPLVRGDIPTDEEVDRLVAASRSGPTGTTAVAEAVVDHPGIVLHLVPHTVVTPIVELACKFLLPLTTIAVLTERRPCADLPCSGSSCYWCCCCCCLRRSDTSAAVGPRLSSSPLRPAAVVPASVGAGPFPGARPGPRFAAAVSAGAAALARTTARLNTPAATASGAAPPGSRPAAAPPSPRSAPLLLLLSRATRVVGSGLVLVGGERASSIGPPPLLPPVVLLPGLPHLATRSLSLLRTTTATLCHLF